MCAEHCPLKSVVRCNGAPPTTRVFGRNTRSLVSKAPANRANDEQRSIYGEGERLARKHAGFPRGRPPGAPAGRTRMGMPDMAMRADCRARGGATYVCRPPGSVEDVG